VLNKELKDSDYLKETVVVKCLLSTELGKGSGRLKEAVITQKAILIKNVG
jgi:hypothetical protein